MVEFLQEVFRVFFRRELHQIFLESDLYNTLLFYFDHYPFHNILHLKICDIFIYLLDKSQSLPHHDWESVINSVLYETTLVKKLLDIARESATYTLKSTGQSLPSGYMPFVRKISNKLVELQKKDDEVANFLDSIPEWAEFVDTHLKRHNEIEAKALGNKVPAEEDTKSQQDDFFEIMFKLKSATGTANNTQQEDSKAEDEDSDEEDNMFGATKKAESLFPQAQDEDEEG